ncbi:hypothetical protein ASZ90_008874 [hydrocarbon metagenome]|uniref:Uncharacterized protein n=1 Tax=hydrocarbon metagenome TaxID=938273 RepID=A0A0W8FKC5_9ZZZZ
MTGAMAAIALFAGIIPAFVAGVVLTYALNRLRRRRASE